MRNCSFIARSPITSRTATDLQLHHSPVLCGHSLCIMFPLPPVPSSAFMSNLQTLVGSSSPTYTRRLTGSTSMSWGCLSPWKKKTHTHQSIESTDKWDKIINDWTSLDSIWILVLKKGKKITGFEFHFVFIVFVKFEQQNNSFIHVLQKIM